MSEAGGLLTGKAALVTGAANGIGRATARLFANQGAAVGVVDLIGDLADEVAGQIRATGGRAVAVQADVADEADVRRAVETVAGEFGGLHILVSNAGVTGGGAIALEAMPLERWDRSLAINLRGHVLMSQAAFPWLKREGGAIICTASSAGYTGLPYAADYGAAKAAVIMLAKELAAEWGKYGIRANSVSPGSIDTGFGRPRQPGQERERRDPAATAYREQWIPLGRVGHAEDVANVILFLASDLAAYVSGVDILVDGGELTNVKTALRGTR